MKLLVMILSFILMMNLYAKDESKRKIDPEVVKALDNMGYFLRSQKEFRLHSEFFYDLVLDNDQKVQLPGNLDYRVRKPDGLIAQLEIDNQKRDFVFDGKTFTVFDPVKRFYGQAPAPQTIKELITQIENKYGIELPLRDLFSWGEEANNKKIVSAKFIGNEKINEVETDHFAVRQGEIDWQIWVTKGEQPLPLKMIISLNSDKARPQFVSHLTWSPLGKQNFAFVAPKGAYKIDLRPLKDVMMMQQARKK